MAGIGGCNRPSSAILEKFHCNPAVDGFYMSKAQISTPRKRQRVEQHPLPTSPSSTRQKFQHSVGYIETPAFWDSLSKIWLTKHALRELNRRNAPPRSAHHRSRPPITRNFLAERKNIRQLASSADFTYRCSSRQLKDIKRLARHGGPNLRDLTGVCTTRLSAFGI